MAPVLVGKMARALVHFTSYCDRGFRLRACAGDSDKKAWPAVLPDKARGARVLVLGGTGRVGGSTATALSKLCPDLRITVGGRNR